jgi:hypothetical protein
VCFACLARTFVYQCWQCLNSHSAPTRSRRLRAAAAIALCCCDLTCASTRAEDEITITSFRAVPRYSNCRDKHVKH